MVSLGITGYPTRACAPTHKPVFPRETLVLRPAVSADAEKLARVLRFADKQELAASHPGRSPQDCLREFMARSGPCICGTYRGETVLLAGLSASTALGLQACVWLLTGKAVARIPVSFVRAAKRVLAHWLTLYPQLTNAVDSRYHAAGRFILHLGGRFTGEKIRLNGISFLQFIFRR